MPAFDIGAIGQQAAGQAASGILGIGLGLINDARQVSQQKKLQKLQIQGQQQMTDYNMQKQYEMWLKTNYGAQVEQMKLAGLNPGLMYGMSGGGGTTTGNATGNVTGGNAPTGGGEIQAMMGMGIQMQLVQAQKELIQAQTEKTKGEAANLPVTAENIQASTANLKQTTSNLQAQQELTKVETELKSLEAYIKTTTQKMAIKIIETQLEQSLEQLEIIKNQHKLSDQTLKDQVRIIKLQAIELALKNALTKAQTDQTKMQTRLTDQQISEVATKIYWMGVEGAGKESESTLKRQQMMDEIGDKTGLPGDIIGTIIDVILLKKAFSPKDNSPTRMMDRN